jgi:hypothetical protein
MIREEYLPGAEPIGRWTRQEQPAAIRSFGLGRLKLGRAAAPAHVDELNAVSLLGGKISIL